MQIIRDFDIITDAPVSVALGNFDGMHLGHQLLIKNVMRLAAELGAVPAVCTFTPHPVKFYNRPVSLICTEEQKFSLLASYGVERCFLVTFNDKFASLTAEEFMQEYLVKKMNAKAVVVGNDYCFGKNRSGNAKLLKEFCDKNGIVCEVVPRLEEHGEPISSSRVRKFIEKGCFDILPRLLGRYMDYCGKVQHGEKIGSKIGFPTANLSIYNELLPPNGVYAGYVGIDGKGYPAMIYLGTRPTFENKKERRFEVNIIGYEPAQPFYGEYLNVFITDKMRDDQKFNSLEELKAQLAEDSKLAKALFIQHNLCHTAF